MDGQVSCLNLLRSGVWYTLLDEPTMERQAALGEDAVVVDADLSEMLQAWNEFVFTDAIHEAHVLDAILSVNDVELVHRVETLYGGDARYEEAKMLALESCLIDNY
jgi:hypothetical protein